MNSNVSSPKSQIKWIAVVPFSVAILYIVLGLIWQPLPELLQGLKDIMTSPSNLVTDYFAVGGLSATLWNSAIVILFELLIIHLTKADFTGGLIATIFLTSGFSFMGTTLPQFLPIFFGIYLYTLIAGVPLGKNLVTGYLASCLGPLVGVIVFGLEFPLHIGLPFGILVGILVGMIVPPCAASFLSFHRGYDIYNVGFTAGIVGLGFVSLFRLFGYKIATVGILSELDLTAFNTILIALFAGMMVLGFVLNGNSLKRYTELLSEKGGLVTDFNALYGIGLTLFNMGLMGIICFIYLFLTKAPFNGIVLSSVMSVMGFGAMGKHPRNGIPLMFGVFIATFLNPGALNPTSAANCALFSTAGGPIAGDFGAIAGIISGMLHAAILGNLTVLHGGVNLYNNGFSIGFVAAILVPLYVFIREKSGQKLLVSKPIGKPISK